MNNLALLLGLPLSVVRFALAWVCLGTTGSALRWVRRAENGEVR